MNKKVYIGGILVEKEYVDALGPIEVAARLREQREDQRRWAQRVTPILLAAGYRLPTSVDEPHARYAWFKIDDRPMDGGLCKLWVVPLVTGTAYPPVDMSKTADRAAYRRAVQAELDAINALAWPRDVNDSVRYAKADATYVRPILVESLQYIDGIPARLAAGDPALEGWEGWVAPKVT